MKPDRWRQVEQLCHAALEREESEQAAFLHAACAGDDALLREVESLLVHQKQAEHFIESSALEMAAQALAQDESLRSSEASRLIGRLVSQYRIVAKVDSGGMGEIYRAVRADGTYEKQVAVKLIRRGFDTEFFLEHFRSERQILAGLEHPNIARLLDGGSTEEGLPFLVMEYIEGQPVDEYCELHGLSIVERLNLFRTVCSAVQFAHKNLVVHRDLKPKNILVTQEGVPKLLDFGIAKILDAHQHEPGADPTVTVLPLMTPDYASPEQVRNGPLTTSSDVYSLGVILYLLLTGHRPYRTKGGAPHEVMKAICDTEPEKPSAAVTRRNEAQATDETHSSARGVHARRDARSEKLRRALTGDLDNIILKALRKEPERRYLSVEQFSEDIRRHLTGLPVLAHQDSFRYRARKFVGRHKLAVGGVALLILSLMAGMIATLREARIAGLQRERAERRFNDVRALAGALLFDINDSIQNIPGTTSARRLLVTKALQYLDSLAREANADPSLQRELATAYQRVGDIQGLLNSQQNLGNTADALQSFRKAAGIREILAKSDPANLTAKSELAMSYLRIGEVSALRNDFAGTRENDRKALAAYQAVHDARPSDAKASRDLAAAYYSTGRHLSMNAAWAEAAQDDLKALSILEPVSGLHPTDKSLALTLAAFYREAGYDLSKAGDSGRAIELCQKAVAVTEELARANPDDVSVRLAPALSHSDLGAILMDKGDLTGSLQNWRKALAIDKEVEALDPKDARTQINLARAYDRGGWVMVALGVPGGIENERKALEIRRKLSAGDPQNSGRLEPVAASHAALGDMEEIFASKPNASRDNQILHWRNARSSYEQGLEIYLKLRARGELRGQDADEPVRITRELAKCDAALAKLKTASPSRRARS